MPPKVKFSRERIVAAATEVVRAAGMPALTARALSEQLQSSVAPIFSVFENMDEVRVEVVKQAKIMYDGYIEEGLKQPMPFKGAGLKYIEFARREPNLFRVLYMSENRGGMDKFVLLDDNNSKIIGALMSYWSLDEDTARKLHKDINIYTHGIAALCVTNSCAFTDEEISERLTFAFMSMLRQIKGEAND